MVSMVALLVVTLLAGCGSSTSGSAGSSTQAKAQGSGSTGTAVAESAVDAKGTTSTAHAVPAHTQSTKPPAVSSTQGAAPPMLRRFSGSGNTRLGTIVVGSPAVLVWRAQHPPVQIFAARGFMLVSSHASSGSIQLSRGIYPGMRVSSRAGWSIELHARSR